jgi:hypothetical protein
MQVASRVLCGVLGQFECPRPYNRVAAKSDVEVSAPRSETSRGTIDLLVAVQRARTLATAAKTTRISVLHSIDLQQAVDQMVLVLF